jgi:radical SAM protein with 4Fe4S-binding SPASM domain
MIHQLSGLKRFINLLFSHKYPSKPALIDIELSNKCNLACNMCWFHGERGVGDKYRGRELTTDEVLRFVKHIAKYKPSIYMGGCEPFIREDFLTILEYIKKLGLCVSFSTNGTLLDSKKLRKLVTLGVDDVRFSIDGYEALHDQIRGKGVFRKAVSGIRELFEYKMESNVRKPFVTVNITITPSIIGHIEKAVREIREATQDKADIIKIHHLWYSTQKELRQHQKEVKKYLHCRAPGAASHLISLPEEIDPLALFHEIQKVIDLPKTRCFPNLDKNGIFHYYSEFSQKKYRCYAPFHGVVIKPNGDVKFCPDEWIDDYIIGNIREDSFEQIWNNKSARNFRSVILWKKSFFGCKRCSWMYSFR